MISIYLLLDSMGVTTSDYDLYALLMFITISFFFVISCLEFVIS